MAGTAVLLWSGFISAVGILLYALEDLARLKSFQLSGILSWEVMRLRTAATSSGVLAEWFEWLYTPERHKRLVMGLMLAALAMLLGPWIPALVPFAAGGVLLGLTLTALRSPYGADGADQMSVVVFAAVFIGTSLAFSSHAVQMSIWFVALQCCLSYFVAGVYKLASPMWRSGEALTGIMSTRCYGNPAVFELLRLHPRIAQVLCWLVIVFECSFPLVFLGNPLLVTVFLVAGGAFHLACAALMGLNGFLWSFVATYPCVWYCANAVRESGFFGHAG